MALITVTRTVVNPAMGVFCLGPSTDGGFEAEPLDAVLVASRWGLCGFYAEDEETLIKRVRAW